MSDLRDYRAEFRKTAEGYIPEKSDDGTRIEYNTAVQAFKIVQDLREKDPQLLDGWLRLMAPDLVRMYLDEIQRARRAGRAKGRGEKFEERLAFHRMHSCEGDTRRRACDMSAADHRFVSGRYEAQAKRAWMLAAFHKAVAEKIEKKPGAATASDVFTAEEYRNLYDTVTKTPWTRAS